MGKQNRQRRAAKQRRRQQQHTRPRPAPGPQVDLDQVVAATVWDTAHALADGDPDAGHLLALLVDGPPAPDGPTVVRRVAADAVTMQRNLLLRNGWTDDDLAELERRRLKVPAAAPEVERLVRLLALLCDVGPLPEVQPAAPVTDDVDTGMLAKIRALLSKAESTTFPEEAESLTAKAQELMARHRIDHAALDDGAGGGEQPVGRRIWLDDPYADAKARLLAAVADANRCQAVQLSSLGCSHVVGFPTDLDVVELLHTSLLVQATTAMAAAGRQVDGRGRSRTRSFRQSFLVAFAWRVGERLLEASAAGEAEGVAVHGEALLPVLARRDDDVEAAVTAVFPHLSRRSIRASNAAGWAAGAAAADLADLSVGERLRAG